MSGPASKIPFTRAELGVMTDVSEGKTNFPDIWKLSDGLKTYQKSINLCNEAQNHPVRMKLEALLETALAITLLIGGAMGYWVTATAGLPGGAILLGL